MLQTLRFIIISILLYKDFRIGLGAVCVHSSLISFFFLCVCVCSSHSVSFSCSCSLMCVRLFFSDSFFYFSQSKSTHGISLKKSLEKKNFALLGFSLLIECMY